MATPAECKSHLGKALKMAQRLMDLADEGREGCHHDGCLRLDGLIRDCAYKIRTSARQWQVELSNDGRSHD